MRCSLRRLAVLVGLALVFSLAFAPAAFAAAPVINGVSPQSGAQFTGGFTVTFSATHATGINGAGATVNVGGNTYRPSVWYAGYWDGDGCDSWWVDDIRSASFSCAVPDPGPGIHTVTISVPSVTGEVATTSITVTRTAALTFSNMSPAPGGTYAWADGMSVTVSGASVFCDSVALVIDGATVPAQCEVVAPGVVVVSAQHVFASGSHSVTVRAGDGSTAPLASKTWNFNVSLTSTPPAIGPSEPANGATVQGPFQLRYHVTDANGVNGAAARVVIAGRAYAPSVTYAGYWDGDGCDTWWTEDRTQCDLIFSIPDLPVGANTLVLEVPDSQANWSRQQISLLRSALMTPAEQTPVPSSHVVSADVVSVVMAGAAVDPATVTMTIDGASAPVSVSSVTNGSLIASSGPVAEGAHTVVVTASDGLGSPAASATWSFTVDATAPAVSSVSPAPDAILALADAGFDIRLADADAVDVASVSLTLDGAAVAATCQTEASGARVRAALVLAEGPHDAVLVARDVAGNELTYPWHFVVADPPRFGAVAPASSLVGDSVTLTAEVYDVNADLDPEVRLLVDGQAVPATLVPTGARRGTITASLTGLAGGGHAVTAYASDTAGNESFRSWNFTADASGPVLQSRSPALGAVLPKHTVSLSATFNDASALDPALVQAWLDGAPLAVSAWNDTRWEGDGCDAYEVLVPETLFVSKSVALQDGSHTVRLRVVDAFGHATVEEWSFTVSEPPALTNVSPAPGAHTMSATVPLSAKVTDFGGVATTAVSWRTAGGSAWQPLSSSFDAATGTLSASFGVPAGDQSYEFLFSAADAGGLSGNATTSIYVDASGPVFDQSAARPVAGSTLTNRKVGFSARFTDSSAMNLPSAVVQVDGQIVPATVVHETTWIGDGCDAYEVELPETLVAFRALELHDGPHTVRVTAADVLGFSTTREWTFSVQEKPVISLVTPAAGSRTTEPAVTVSAKVTDYDGIAATGISWREANTGRTPGEWQTATSTYDPASGVLTAQIALPRSDTRYEFSISGTDSGGLVTTATTNLFVASTAAHIEAPTACLDCHAGVFNTHIMTDCVACHGTPTGPCDCHGVGVHGTNYLNGAWIDDHGNVYQGRVCIDCHSHQADVEAQRHASGSPSTCAPCHEQSLVAEHAGISVNGVAFTCYTCHSSTDATVQAAIAGHRTDCASCHSVTSGHNELHRSPDLADTIPLFSSYHGGSDSMYVDCGLCHRVEDVSGIHGNTCAVCHPSPRDSFTAWTGGCQQGGCHPAIHAEADAGHKAAEAADSCDCHRESDWSVTTDYCGACHELVDRIPPVTTTDAVSQYVGTATIRLSATDTPSPGGSGVASTHYQVDGGAEQTGATVVVTNTSNQAEAHTVTYWSVDGAGNTEATQQFTFSFIVDLTAPVTHSDAVAHYYGPATITLNASDDSGIAPATYYSLDGATAQQGLTVAVAQPAAGTASHTLSYWSVDAAGNAESPTSVTFEVEADDDAPVTTSTAKPFYKYGSAETIAFLADDHGGTGVVATYWSLDGSAASQAPAVGLSGLAAGAHELEFWSVDGVGNEEEHRAATFSIDATAPTTTTDAKASYVGAAVITLAAADGADGSGVAATYYRLDNAAAAAGTSVTVNTGGSHRLTYWSVDAVGNTETAKTANFVVDMQDFVAPTTTSDVQPTFVGVPTIHLTATDAGSGVKATYYRLNGGPETQGTVVTCDGRVNQTIEFWSVDNANNAEAHQTLSFVVLAPPGHGTVQFAWNAPRGAWSEYYLYVTQGSLFASASNATGWWGVHVPVSSTPYSLRVWYYDPELEEYTWSYGTALIDSEGKVITWWY